jgi:hypothetical protein
MSKRSNEAGTKKPARRRAGGPAAREARSEEIREPTVEEIRIRAYEIYLARGAEPGRELDDWLEAERELRARR